MPKLNQTSILTSAQTASTALADMVVTKDHTIETQRALEQPLKTRNKPPRRRGDTFWEQNKDTERLLQGTTLLLRK